MKPPKSGTGPLEKQSSRDTERSYANMRDPKLKYMAVGLAHGPGKRKKKRKK